MISLDDIFQVCTTEPNSGCHLWLGRLSSEGYAFLSHPSVGVLHRYVYELAKGPIPVGFVIDHKCRVRCCLNADHLDAVTPIENSARGLLWKTKAFKSKCGMFSPEEWCDVRPIIGPDFELPPSMAFLREHLFSERALAAIAKKVEFRSEMRANYYSSRAAGFTES
jgi:hypothetical protein